ncbi:hypothetical protein RHMOL_Rhmol05G0193600 [Rhododendron molle]|uniref:Uncharacterized protein n=1 Tax=Rhododendron molle TaxID=49168 RepID=A0ACC0NR03_RHOML|nr:hypothetical protein RHMOL_Rhmol05G0193600 [Rhododendron molle]
MSILLSTWSRNVQSVPANYVFPEDKRPGGDITAPVINHGVSEELMDETINVFKDFFNMPAEDKAMHYSKDGTTGFRHYTSGLGVELGYFGDELSKLHELAAHHYPPYPDPSLLLGFGGHTDTNLLTLLQQNMYGLQIFKDGQWLGVEPIPHAFVINICDQLEVISNGKLKSARHRVVMNTNVARTSLATFISPSLESIIEHERALVSASEPQLFKSFRFKEYRDTYIANLREPKGASPAQEAYKL